ncbi:phage tail sheath subtilisin-like domain-containing protein [Roseovarius ramblicola]|uniref:Phage tail sheath subtilisin-like domain-containing protein n=1 Tax=Roseovarius ramblicola TaxID=2022336 RepID=A0ABV5HZ23_9RHOB
MADKFLHGVEVIEIDTGPRPIRTVRTGVIGIVGTAPDAAGATAATLTTGRAAINTEIVLTAVTAGVAGNAITLSLVDPGDVSQALAVTVAGNAISVSLATDVSGVVTSTAGDVITALDGDASAAALVSAANGTGSDGTGVVSPTLAAQSLSGGAAEPFPLNTPVLVAGSRTRAAGLDSTGDRKGTLPGALDGIFDQIGAVVIVVRVAEGADEAETLANVVGGVNSGTGNFEGVHALAGAESVVGFAPRILCAPGFTHQRPDSARNPVVAELVGIADRGRAVIIADGPNTTDEAAITYRGDWGSDRVFIVDPWVEVLGPDGDTVTEPASARVCGMIARSDNDRGFWFSPSNRLMSGILGTARPIDFKLGDANARANLLNEQEVATIIRQDGYRLWGNRSAAADPKWAFLSVRRTADILAESLQRAHLWAVDRNITKTYVEDVTDGVNAFLRGLTAQGAILGGRCWPDPDLNTPENIAQGKVFFNFDFTPPYPAEHITFRSQLVNTYIQEVFA